MYNKSRSNDACFLRHGVQQTDFLSLWTIFCPLTPLTTQKIIILKRWKKKKKHLEILLFYRCVQMKIMIYGSWDIERNRHFLPFDRPNKLKNQNFEKIKKQNEKKIWTYYHFAIVYHKWHHMMMYADNFLTFCAIFLPYYTTNNPEK